LLPIVLGTSTVKRHPMRPVAIVLGFTLAFTGFAIAFSLFGSVLGLSPDAWRYLASIIIALFGVMLLFPKIQTALFARLEPFLAKVMPKTDPNATGLGSGFLLGLTLGAVWTPCAGPVLGSILTLVAAKQNLNQAAVLLFAFALGAGIPMLLIAYGGQYAVTRVRSLSKYSTTLQKIFGVIIILAAIGFVTHLDTILLSKLPSSPFVDSLSPSTMPMPSLSNISPSGTPSNLPVLANSMPPFQGISQWWNTENGQPLTPDQLKGKVVLVDFWTYSCINCIRTQPFLKKIWDTYKDDGLVIVGVHTPEFAFEKVPANLDEAIKKAGLTYPIALDADYSTWNAYGNQYWPAGYFFDRQGRLRFTHFGEGNYDEQEQVIRDLLAEGGPVMDQPTGLDVTPNFALTETPETYFGSARAERFTQDFEHVAADQWSTKGDWNVTPEYDASNKAGNAFRMNVQSNAMYLVLGSADGKPKKVVIKADGNTLSGEVTVTDRQLYPVAEFPNGGRHDVVVEVVDPGVEFYAATFGK
ncbi:MAG TPA: cytochrome c biogenesis protein CcdA, partial [Verrucomicrobiae bacterium]|nr:cytochrome c biogenesis protein CcdA [Verrucomicrobiae bacterium]